MSVNSYESQKSSFCESGGCVEIIRFDEWVAVFDSNLEGKGGAIVVPKEEFDTFEEGVRTADLPATSIFPNQGEGYTDEDIYAWKLGLKAGEFALRDEMYVDAA